ncbi:hypothetical protein Q1695_006417 [Nippostrongylus brasiliensis]|nr:hypothetical protein Q1695_006417 [Nippostrongylus brasiliensis]
MYTPAQLCLADFRTEVDSNMKMQYAPVNGIEKDHSMLKRFKSRTNSQSIIRSQDSAHLLRVPFACSAYPACERTALPFLNFHTKASHFVSKVFTDKD